jgi:hypothetical protein
MASLVKFLIFPHSYNYCDFHGRLIHHVVFILHLEQLLAKDGVVSPFFFFLPFLSSHCWGYNVLFIYLAIYFLLLQLLEM